VCSQVSHQLKAEVAILLSNYVETMIVHAEVQFSGLSPDKEHGRGCRGGGTTDEPLL
jgi:hypothetical protein